jgi:hypothetical protein
MVPLIGKLSNSEVFSSVIRFRIKQDGLRWESTVNLLRGKGDDLLEGICVSPMQGNISVFSALHLRKTVEA